MILGFPTTKHRLCSGTCRMRGYQPLIYFSLISSQNFIILIGFICYMMTYSTSYYTFWFDWFFFFGFPTVKYANTKGALRWALLTVFFLVFIAVKVYFKLYKTWYLLIFFIRKNWDRFLGRLTRLFYKAYPHSQIKTQRTPTKTPLCSAPGERAGRWLRSKGWRRVGLILHK